MTFTYPKNSYKVNVNFNRERLNGHEFNIGQFLGHIARTFGKAFSFLNPFGLSSGGLFGQTTTTESIIDFETDDPDAFVSGGDSSESTSTDTDKSTDGEYSGDNGHSVEPSSSTRSGYSYTTPTTKKTGYSYPSPTTKSSGYLPPNFKRQ